MCICDTGRLVGKLWTLTSFSGRTFTIITVDALRLNTLLAVKLTRGNFESDHPIEIIRKQEPSSAADDVISEVFSHSDDA